MQLNDDECVIINTQTTKKITDDKELFCYDDNISYDEIAFLYYGIPSSTYYLFLYEKLNSKIIDLRNDDKISHDENNNISTQVCMKDYNDFDKWLISYMSKNKNDENFKFLDVIESNIDYINRYLSNDHELVKKDFIGKQTSLTKLRNLIAHGNEEKTYYFYNKKRTDKKLFSTETKNFFDKYNDKQKNINLLKQLTNVLRNILVKI